MPSEETMLVGFINTVLEELRRRAENEHQKSLSAKSQGDLMRYEDHAGAASAYRSMRRVGES